MAEWVFPVKFEVGDGRGWGELLMRAFYGGREVGFGKLRGNGIEVPSWDGGAILPVVDRFQGMLGGVYGVERWVLRVVCVEEIGGFRGEEDAITGECDFGGG